jgi:hypothetical protein
MAYMLPVECIHCHELCLHGRVCVWWWGGESGRNQVPGMSLPGVVVYTSISFTAYDSVKVGGRAANA